MRELDVMLEGWLERHWASADRRCREAFAELLACEDDRLWYWLSGRGEPGHPAQAEVVARIRTDHGIDPR